MEIVHLENINLAEVLPRINDINVLPFGVVKMDLTGKILEYNMAEAELTGTDPAWALGKNFFKEVATCTNTPAFHGKFVHMMTMPDSRGQQIVVMLVTRVNQPVQVTEAFHVHSGTSPLTPVLAEAAPSHSDAAASGVANAIMSAANNQPRPFAPAEPISGSATIK